MIGFAGGILRLKLAAPVREGKANKELIDYLAERFGIVKSQMNIVEGYNARDKVIAISGLSEEEVKQRLEVSKEI